jgi:SAM-dependent methyltransferase
MDTSNLQSFEDDVLKHLHDTVENPVCYDLGCGVKPMAGFVGLDYLAPVSDTVLRADLYAEPWSFERSVSFFDINEGEERTESALVRIPDESVDYYISSHFIEHVPDWDLHFREVYRTLKPGGFYKVVAPYYTSVRAYQDPDHKQFISEHRFMYLDAGWRAMNHISHYGAQVNFSVQGMFFLWHPDFAEETGISDEARRYAKEHYLNVVDDVAVVLRKEPLPEKG